MERSRFVYAGRVLIPRALVLSSILAAAAVLADCGRTTCPELPAAAAVSDQPYGGACVGNADCASGLSCLGPIVSNSGWKMCSTACDPCPPDTATCLTFDTATGEKLCIPSCTSDSDCVRGDHVMRCSKSTDEPTGQCLFIQCNSRKDLCPAGSHCVGELCTEVDQGYGLHSGYCQKDR